jgi:hypothetical protein
VQLSSFALQIEGNSSQQQSPRPVSQARVRETSSEGSFSNGGEGEFYQSQETKLSVYLSVAQPYSSDRTSRYKTHWIFATPEGVE